MGSGLLQRAMPGSLKPAFTHSDSQRRLQSQCSGLVPRALGGRAGCQGPPACLAHRLCVLGLLEKQNFWTLPRLAVFGLRTSGLPTVPVIPGDVSTPQALPTSEALFSPIPVRQP